jgi:hypothetical protein
VAGGAGAEAHVFGKSLGAGVMVLIADGGRAQWENNAAKTSSGINFSTWRIDFNNFQFNLLLFWNKNF